MSRSRETIGPLIIVFAMKKKFFKCMERTVLLKYLKI